MEKKSYELWANDQILAAENGHTKPINGFGNENYGYENEPTDTAMEDGHSQTPLGEKGEEYDRGQFGNRTEFVLSCIGLSVGLGNVWRFPYLAYANGGAAFLIAYLILQLLIGKPMYLMELVMGQFTSRGPTGVWAMNPAAKGVGVSMAIIALDVAIYYNVIMAYILYYFFSSMQTTLPWTICKDGWIGCVENRSSIPPKCSGNFSLDVETNCQCAFNESYNQMVNCSTGPYYTTSESFFYYEVIQRSKGIEPENMGIPMWRLTLCLLLSWIIVVACLIKGVKSSGKVVYFTATFPYVVLLILLVKGSTLDGAVDGVLYFIVPKWEMLADLKVWTAAAGQMFFSLSVSFGGIIMFGSYNHFKNNVYVDSLLISIMDLITSIIAGFVIFTTFGGMAKQIGGGTKVENIVQGAGYGLAFIAYPEALSSLPPPQLWAVLFFFMLYTLGLDSEFGLLETTLTCIQDEFPSLRPHKTKLCIGFSIACFIAALPCVCPGGDYVVTILDNFGADFSVLMVATVETISVMWVYGVLRFIDDIEFMLGFKPHGRWYWIFCWTITSPLLIGLLFIYRVVTFTGPKYPTGVPFPDFANGIAFGVLGLVLCPIPLNFFYQLIFRADGTLLQRLRQITRPTDKWLPAERAEEYRLKHSPNTKPMQTYITNCEPSSLYPSLDNNQKPHKAHDNLGFENDDRIRDINTKL